MQVFVTISKRGIKINADVNAKNWLTKLDATKDLFGIQIIDNVSADKSCEVGEYLDYEYWKKLKNKLVEEFAENIDEPKIARITLAEHKNVCKYSCAIYVALIAIVFAISIDISTYLFTTNTWIKTKKLVLHLIMSIKQHIININGKHQRN